jgi:hypothetical protein
MSLHGTKRTRPGRLTMCAADKTDAPRGVLVLGQGPDNSARWIGNRSQSFREASPRHNFHLLTQPDQDVVEHCNLLLVVGGAARDKKIRQAHQDGGPPAEVDIRASSGQFINQASAIPLACNFLLTRPL